MKLRNLLLILFCGLSVPLGADTIFKKLTREPPLPPELSTDVDVIQMPRSRSTWNPLNFSPYRVAKYHSGTKKTWFRSGPQISWPSLSVDLNVPDHSRRHDSFRLNEGEQEVLRGECIWRELFNDSGFTATNVVDCTFTGTDGQPVWTLVFSDANGGHLTSGDIDLAVDFMFVSRGDWLVGDLPGGYLFTERDTPVAALQMKAAAGATKLTLKRSLPEDERRAVAAAVAALVIGLGSFGP